MSGRGAKVSRVGQACPEDVRLIPRRATFTNMLTGRLFVVVGLIVVGCMIAVGGVSLTMAGTAETSLEAPNHQATAPEYSDESQCNGSMYIQSAIAIPQSANVSQAVCFSSRICGGRLPYEIEWTFDDRTAQTRLRQLSHGSQDVIHRYMNAGVYNAMVTVRDASKSSISTYVPVYVGANCRRGPDARVAVQQIRSEVAKSSQSPTDSVPEARISVTLLGRFLGRYRLTVDSEDGHGWRYNDSGSSPESADSTSWTTAVCNNFHVDWFGECQLRHGRSQERCIGFPPGTYTVRFAYLDSWGQVLVATEPVDVHGYKR